jgi:hypothetical protein
MFFRVATGNQREVSQTSQFEFRMVQLYPALVIWPCVFDSLIYSTPNPAGFLPIDSLVCEAFLGARLLGLVGCVPISMAFSKLHRGSVGFTCRRRRRRFFASALRSSSKEHEIPPDQHCFLGSRRHLFGAGFDVRCGFGFAVHHKKVAVAATASFAPRPLLVPSRPCQNN